MRPPKSLGLRARLALIVLLSVIPAFAFILHDAKLHRDDALTEARDDVIRFAEHVADEYRTLLGMSQQFLLSLSRITELQSLETTPGTMEARAARAGDRCNAFLAALIKIHPAYANIGVINRDGMLICSALPFEQPINLADRAYFRIAIETRQFSVGEFQIGYLTGRPSVNIAHPVVDRRNRIQAIVFAAIDLDWLGRVLLAQKATGHFSIALVDGSGTVGARYPDPEKWFGRSLTDSPLREAFFGQESRGAVAAPGFDGKPAIHGFVRVYPDAPAKGFVMVAVPETPILERIQRNFATSMALMGVVALLVLALAWWCTGALVLRRVNRLTGAAERLSAGDLGARTNVSANGDELATLARTFDNMAESLQSRNTELRHANRALRTLSAGNHALLHTDDEQQLLSTMCRVAVEQGGYKSAWVAYAEEDAEKTIRPVAQFGIDESYLASLRLTWSDTEQGRGLLGTAIRTGKPYAVRSVVSDPAFAPWRGTAAQHGYGSAIALPLRATGKVIGALALYTAEAGAFDDAELKLLEELAADLGFGITTVRLRLEHQRAAEELDRSEQRLRLHVEQTPLAVIEWDLDFKVTGWNPAAELIFGFTRAEALGQHIFFILPQALWKRVEMLGGTANGKDKGGQHDVVENMTKDGRKIFCEWHYNAIVDGQGKVIGAAAAVQDVTERKYADETIRQLAYFDSLTALPNRVLLRERLKQAITDAEIENRSVALLTLNITRFSDLQDGLGYSSLEALLQEITHRLEGVVSKDETLAYMGVDTFAILLRGGGINYALEVVNNVVAAMRDMFQVSGIMVYVDLSIGISLYPGHGTGPGALILRSDIAARQARETGRKYVVYAGATDREDPERLALIANLRNAINSDQLFLHYQPKVDLHSKRVCGAEALVRWQHPERGTISPGEFIPLAEQTGLIRPLTYWVLDAAIRQCLAWRKEELETPVAVNLSAQNLRDPKLLDRIKGLFTTWGIPTTCLQIEITESTLMEDPAASLEVLGHFKNLGIQLFIDDFGTGYSSLGYLATLPVHALKVDRSFIIKMAEQPDHMSIVSSIISLAHSLNLKVVAEGVDSDEQLRILRRLKCDEIQGYLYSRPLPPEKFRDWYAKFESRR